MKADPKLNTMISRLSLSELIVLRNDLIKNPPPSTRAKIDFLIGELNSDIEYIKIKLINHIV